MHFVFQVCRSQLLEPRRISPYCVTLQPGVAHSHVPTPRCMRSDCIPLDPTIASSLLHKPRLQDCVTLNLNSSVAFPCAPMPWEPKPSLHILNGLPVPGYPRPCTRPMPRALPSRLLRQQQLQPPRPPAGGGSTASYTPRMTRRS